MKDVKISTVKPESYFVRAGIIFFVFLCCLLLGNIVRAKAISSDGGSASNETIEVSPETVAPAWQLIWEKARHMGRSGDVEGAIALYQNLLKQRPGLSEARFELSGLFLRAGRKQSAMIELEKVLEARPQHLRALLSMAELLKDSGRYRRAVDLYKRAEVVLDRQAHTPLAKRDENVLSDNSKDADYFRVETGLYQSLKGLHRDREALVHLKKALSIRPEDKSLEFKLACDLLDQGRSREALAHLRRLAPAFRDNPLFVRKYVRAMDACSMISGIRKLLEPLVQPLTRSGTSAPRGWSVDDLQWGIQKLYGIYLLDEDIKSAVALLQGVKDAHPELISPSLLRSLGRIYFSQRRYIACVNTFTSLVVRCPKDREAYLFLARAFQKLQMINKAADSYVTAYSMTGDQTYIARAVELLARAGMFSRAKALVAEYSDGKLRPGVLSAGLLLRIYAGVGDLEDTLCLLDRNPGVLESAGAARDFLGVVARLPGRRSLSHGIIRYMLLCLRVLGSHSQENRPWIMTALDGLSLSGRQDVVNRFLLGIWQQSHDLWAVARLYRNGAFPKAPGMVSALFPRIKTGDKRLEILQSGFMIRAGQAEQALKKLRGLSASGGWTDEISTLRIAEIYLHRKDYRGAMRCYEKLLSLYPDHLSAHEGRFRIYALRGQWVQANWEALGIFIIRGDFPELKASYRTTDSGSVMNGIHTGLPDPGKILSGPLCKDGGQACQLLLAFSYEAHGDVLEAVAAWKAFLKRNPSYLPGYGRLARLLRSIGDIDGSLGVKKLACGIAENSAGYKGDAAFRWPPEPPWINGGPRRFWDVLDAGAMSVWQHIYCAH